MSIRVPLASFSRVLPCISIAGCIVAVGATAPSMASPPHPPLRTVVPAGVRAAAPARFGRRRALDPEPETCTTQNEYASFIGLPGYGDVAGGLRSAVLAGYQNEACDPDSVIGGGDDNDIGFDGSAQLDFIGAGDFNTITSEYSFIGAGQYNAAQSFDSFVGAGSYNAADGAGAFVGAGDYVYSVRDGNGASTPNGNVAAGADSFVGAGDLNQVTGNGSFIGAGGYSFVNGGGTSGANQVSGVDSFIGAGDQNAVTTDDAFIGGGALNYVGSNASYSAIAGGYQNTMLGQKASLGGGEQNKVSGSFATIPGGYHDEALGNESFAAGSQAEARYAGSFVWSDYVSTEKPQTDSRAGEFVARASGGVYFFSNAASSAGVHLASGSGAWSSLSDRNAKTDVVPLDDASILAKVAALPVSAWQYKTERGVRHVGPMAQDFYAAFGVGEDDRHITSIDEDGIALAAIKALEAQGATQRRAEERKDAAIAELRDENAILQSKLAVLAAKVDGIVRDAGRR